MFLYDHFSVDEKGHLKIEGVDTVELAKKYGTPLYVMSANYIRNACEKYHEVMKSFFGENYSVAYASKALSAKFIYRLIKPLNMHVDVVSGGEIYTALAAGYDSALMHFHGGNKTRQEIAYAIDKKIGRIVIDNFQEIRIIDEECKKRNTDMAVILRIKPGVDAHTHEFISTGKEDTKFGFGIGDGQAFNAIEEILRCENLKLMGFHCHIGSQLLESKPYSMAGKVMADFMALVREKYGITLKELIMGGGFGVKYTYEDKPESLENMIGAFADAIKLSCSENDFPVPFVTIEPGRSIVAPAGITLYEIGTLKELEGIRNYVSVDGGMTDNPRYALYDARYECCVANRANEERNYKATVAGKCCESGDMVTKDIYIQTPKPGDILCTFTTGAYNYSMASNYNKTPRPAMVLVDGKDDTLVIERESFEDLVRLER